MKNCKKSAYYEELIIKLKSSVMKIKNNLDEGKVVPRMVDNIKFMYIERKIKILIAKYSKGDSKNTLKLDFQQIINEIENLWTEKAVKLKDNKGNLQDIYILDCYLFMRWLLSFAILLDVDDEDFMVLVNLIKRDNIKDKLYDYFISSRIGEWNISESLALIKPKNKITEIINIDNKQDCEIALKNYLNKDWHKTYKYFNAYNSQNKPDDMYLFFGCWAFEVAAIVKIKALDDTSFKDNKYYPERLL